MAVAEIMAILRQVLTIDSRVEDLLRTLGRLEEKLDGYTERLARLEVQYSHLRESLRSQIVGEVLGEVLSTAAKVDSNYNQLRREICTDVISVMEGRARGHTTIAEAKVTDD